MLLGINCQKKRGERVNITSIQQLIGWLILLVFSVVLFLNLGFAKDKAERKKALLNILLFSAGTLSGAFYF